MSENTPVSPVRQREDIVSAIRAQLNKRTRPTADHTTDQNNQTNGQSTPQKKASNNDNKSSLRKSSSPGPKPVLTSEIRSALKPMTTNIPTPPRSNVQSYQSDEIVSSIADSLAALQQVQIVNHQPKALLAKRITFKSRNRVMSDSESDTENEPPVNKVSEPRPLPSLVKSVVPPKPPIATPLKARRVPLIHRLRPKHEAGELVPLTSSSTPAEEAAARLLQSNDQSVFSLLPVESPTNDESKARKARQTVVLLCAELLSTERTYVNKLGELVSHYVRPLNIQHAKLGLSQEDVQLLFSYIQPIVDLHEKIVEQLKSAVINKGLPMLQPNANQSQSDPSSAIANACVSTITDTLLSYGAYLKMYNHYVNNYNASLEVLQRLSDNKKFGKFCIEARPSQLGQANSNNQASPTFDLQSYLIMPVQRIPRYEMLLSSMLKLLDQTWPAYPKLCEALKAIQSIASMINESKRAAENALRMMAWKKRLKNCSIPLLAPHRRLLREDEIAQLRPKKRSALICVLFSDAFLLVNDASMRVKGWYMFDDLNSIEIFDDVNNGAANGETRNDSDYDEEDADDVSSNEESFCVSIRVKATMNSANQSTASNALKRFSMAFATSAATAAHTLVLQFQSDEERASWMSDVQKFSTGASLIDYGRSENTDSTKGPATPVHTNTSTPAPCPPLSLSERKLGTEAVPAIPARPRPSPGKLGTSVQALIQQHDSLPLMRPGLALRPPTTGFTTPVRATPTRQMAPAFVPAAHPSPSSRPAGLISELKNAIKSHHVGSDSPSSAQPTPANIEEVQTLSNIEVITKKSTENRTIANTEEIKQPSANLNEPPPLLSQLQATRLAAIGVSTPTRR